MNWYKTSQFKDLELEEELEALLQELRGEYPGIQLEGWISQGRYIEVANIKVPSNKRGQGIGTTVMNRIQDFARDKNLKVVVRPEPERGKKKALDNFYRKLDFVHNKGRNRDFTLSTPFAPTMYWSPK